MLAIPGYQTLDLIYESDNSIVYRGKRQTDGLPVILKVLKQNHPTPEELSRYQQEYEITRSLHIFGVVNVYDLQNYQNTLVIILEDFGGNRLKKFGKMSVTNFLPLAIQITEALGRIHTNNIIHKDINPANIVWNAETNQLKIIDFGIASRLPRENPTLKNPELLEGTLAYISPEQTGRMNRSLDYRTDLYSLGVTFYELLTGTVPFKADSAMELVHCHIAKTPQSVREANPEIPQTLSDLVAKLMEKNAEDRYQSAFGVKWDLEKCQENLPGFAFELAQNDFSGKLQIPQKLYGREKEIKVLLQAFERVSQGSSEMMLVAGYSGVGKTALVHEVHKPMTEKRGYFAAGKFDQFQKNIPYSAITQAFNGFCRYLLKESAETLDFWQKKILKAVGNNGQVIIDVIPDLELVIGSQPPVAQVGPTEAQNRFQLFLLRFIKSLCEKDHPFILFIDDLQWVDSGSLNILKSILLDDEIQHLFIIGAYRDNEVDSNHPFIIAVSELQKANAIINTITVSNLLESDVNELLQESLWCEVEQTQPLTNLIYQKTQGNAFFTHQFLHTFYADALLQFDFEKQKWQWDVEQITTQNITANVVDLMAGKINKLPVETSKALQLAACIGNQFDLPILAIISEQNKNETLAVLTTALTEGLILPLDENYKHPELVSQSQFKFLHDRVQQAAYALIDDAQKQAIHLQIGRLLLKDTSTLVVEDKVFDIVNQLNVGMTLLTDKTEKIKLAELNLLASQKAKNTTAYTAADKYVNAGIACLTANSWEYHYQITFNLYKMRAELEYLNGNFQNSEILINLVLEKAKSIFEKVDVYVLLIIQLTMQTRYVEATQTGLEALNLLGIEFRQENLEAAFHEELAHIKNNLKNRTIASLLNSPEISVQEKMVANQLLSNLQPLTFMTNRPLFQVVTLKAVNLSLQYGQAAEAAHSYAWYSHILGPILQDYQASYEFGMLSLKIADKFNNLTQKCKAFDVFSNFASIWVQHLKQTNSLNSIAYEAALASGELAFAGYNLVHQLFNAFCQGAPLSELVLKSRHFVSFTEKIGHQYASDALLGAQLAILNLHGITNEKASYHNKEINDIEYLARYSNKNFYALCRYQVIKSQVLYLYGQFSEALQCVLEAEKIRAFILGTISVAEHNFYYSLCLTALTVSVSKQPNYWEKLKINQKQMKIWADNCPENFLHQYLLVEAEIARISGKALEAMDLYERAIVLAKENEFIHIDALSNELAGKFYLGRGLNKIAQIYLKEAYYRYQQWGAIAKVQDLEERYPQWLLSSQTMSPTLMASTSMTQRGTTALLDLDSIVKASQALSSEIRLDKLLEKMIHTVVENAGAQRGLLILEKQCAWVIEAQWILEQEQVDILQSLPLSGYVPSSIINYVTRTKESVVLDKASEDSLYQNDDYVSLHHLKSVLCMPIISQKKLVGIIYLENNLAENVFTPRRIEILSLLSSQIAISLENATFVEDLEATRRQAEVANQTKTAFLANVSHELRTPLNGILGHVQLANRHTELPVALRESHRVIQQSGEYLLTLINDIIDISTVETGETALTLIDFRLDNFLNSLAEIFRTQAREKHLKFNTLFSEELPLGIFSDEKRLRQILTHLLSNAVKFTQQGTITFTVTPHEEEIRFLVEDTGIGIAPEDLEKIFLPFEQVSDWKHKSEGAGLGLSLAIKLVKALDGELHTESQIGQGSRFWVDLPLAESKEWQGEKLESTVVLEEVARTDELESDANSSILLEAAISLLSAKQIATLYDLSMNGDVIELAKQANELEKLDPKFSPLVEKIRETTKVYDTDTIGDLLERFIYVNKH